MTLRSLTLWPSSLAARTALLLLGGLLVAQVGGLSLHALDRAEMLHAAQEYELSRQVIAIYRSLVLARPEQRANLIDQSRFNVEVTVRLSNDQPVMSLPPAPAALQRRLRSDMQMTPLPQSLRPSAILVHSDEQQARVMVALQLPEGQWLDADMVLSPIWPWHSGAFLPTFAAMSIDRGDAADALGSPAADPAGGNAGGGGRSAGA